MKEYLILFVFLSNYCAHQSNRDSTRFLSKKIVRFFYQNIVHISPIEILPGFYQSTELGSENCTRKQLGSENCRECKHPCL
jgi:hypothetical protein